MSNSDEFRELLSLYITKGLDPAQKRRLADLLQDPVNEAVLEEEMRESFFEQGVLTEASDTIVDRIMEGLQPKLSARSRFKIIRYGAWWAAAASVVLLLAGVTWYLVKSRPAEIPGRMAVKSIEPDVQPAHKGAATLKLANGQLIHLDSIAPGLIARQGNIEIIKGSDGDISYHGANTGEVIYNEIMTIKGQVLTVTLPDGSVAALNTASSLRYPLVFRKGERDVAMTGEVHFKVKHDKNAPFRLQVKGQIVEDIGTEFNINAYEDEPVIRTTLVEGSVSINKGKTDVILQPGQQAISIPGQDALKVSRADMDLNLAWYKGVFSYKHANITTVMREFSRWYNIDVEYKDGAAPDATFTGDMGRDLTLAQALDGLKRIGIHYHIEENHRLTILP